MAQITITNQVIDKVFEMDKRGLAVLHIARTNKISKCSVQNILSGKVTKSEYRAGGAKQKGRKATDFFGLRKSSEYFLCSECRAKVQLIDGECLKCYHLNGLTPTYTPTYLPVPSQRID